VRTGDGPVRDEERGTRELPAEGADGSRRIGDSVGGADGIDGIPEQARPHPEDDADSAAAAGFPDDGQRDREGAVQSTPLDGRNGVTPVRAEARARRRATGGTMSEHERNAEGDGQNAQRVPQATQHDAQDRSGARKMFIELRSLKDGSPEYAELRNKLVRMHLPLVEHLARRFRNRGEPLDDLTQVATIGLIKSVDRFDLERGVEFSTYATPTIIGEVKRYFRDKGWAIRVPRRLQELRMQIGATTADLTQTLGRSPTPRELAEAIGCPVEEIIEGIESSNAYATLSLDATDDGNDDGGFSMLDVLGIDDEELEQIEIRESIKPLLEALPHREKRILLLRFFRNKTQSEIAADIGVSQMHVSRLLTRTLDQLRATMQQEQV